MIYPKNVKKHWLYSEYNPNSIIINLNVRIPFLIMMLGGGNALGNTLRNSQNGGRYNEC